MSWYTQGEIKWKLNFSLCCPEVLILGVAPCIWRECIEKFGEKIVSLQDSVIDVKIIYLIIVCIISISQVIAYNDGIWMWV